MTTFGELNILYDGYIIIGIESKKRQNHYHNQNGPHQLFAQFRKRKPEDRVHTLRVKFGKKMNCSLYSNLSRLLAIKLH
jgi:hypothetical protein